MTEIVTFDENSRIFTVFIRDSASTTGAGKTGLVYNTSGLIISTRASSEATATNYKQADSTIEDITTLGTYAAPTATKCRFKEVDATNLPGIYEVQLADARLSIAGATHLLVMIHGATGVVPCALKIPLMKFDLMDSTPIVSSIIGFDPA